MKITIEEKSGFCFGVKRVIETAEKILDTGEKLYCLGEIVHNKKEVERLTERGLEFIDHEELRKLSGVKVLIRAHGEPPETFRIAEENTIELIDGTCPIVTALQKKIRRRFEDSSPGTRIFIYGKKGHPEVNGLNGQTGYSAKVISSADEITREDRNKSLALFSQTTMDSEGFNKVGDKLKELAGDEHEVEINNTICNHISHRKPGIEAFAQKNEVILFVAGRNSSNGRILFEICRKKNPNTYFVSELAEIDPAWFENAASVGICGATSTPVWFLESVRDVVEHFTIN